MLWSFGRSYVMDFFYILGVYAFFVISWGLVRLCEGVQ